MTPVATSLKKQLALAQEENERHATSLDTVVAALNEALTALESHDPDFVAGMRARFGVSQMTTQSGVVGALTAISNESEKEPGLKSGF
ncbi:hypothetical protein [Sinorhizobium sp. NFACC03]|uniref:hypothetical protein n=1 Tax=Sinorhizobium sp. NFACC03 TaxID=1566295 RepID=UPI00088ED36B|nr:hypothetical protein [Sinorhizobium sp. NFACC03]SDA39520.1 hypothetical protein SAMN03159448_00196 [Sinorhizobium sp. NFACC03]